MIDKILSIVLALQARRAGAENELLTDLVTQLLSATVVQGRYLTKIAKITKRLRVGERSSGMEHYRQSQEAERKATGRRQYVGNMGRDYMAYRLEQVKSRIIARYQQKGGIGVTDI